MSLAQLFYLKESIRKQVRRRFPRKKTQHASRFTLEPLENRLLLSMTPVAPDLTSVLPNATNLEPTAITQAASPNQTVSFQLDYQDTGSGTATTGLGLRLHYNSNQLRPGEAGLDGQFSTGDDVLVLTNLFGGAASTVKIGPQDQADSSNFDGDASTDRFVLMSWADFSGQFPKGPAALFTANWTTTADFTGTTVHFTTSSRPPGRALNAPSAEITLGETNQVPVLETIGNQAVDEGQVLTFTIDATDADVPPDTLTYSATGLPPGATFDPTTRTFNWTPTEDQGPQSYTGITFAVTGGRGGTDSETISVTVNEVNQAPVLNAIGTKTVTVGQPLTFTVTATDADLPANVLTVSSTTLPAGASFDATTGQFSWTPGSGQLGQTNLIFTVQDNGTPPLSDSEPVTITVRAEPNANPVAVNDGVYAATEDQLLTVAPAQGVLVNDSDPNTDALSATLLTQATHGIITLASDGGFTYQPATDFNGNDSFTYSVSDGRGGTASATVNLTVAPLNDAPVLGVIGNKTVQVGQPLTFTVNATDADVPADVLTFGASGLPTGATFDSTTRNFSWTPMAGQLGDAEITFTVTDNGGPQLSDSETITINVTPIPNRNPVADDEIYTIGQDQVLSIAAPGVLEGDTDADGDELSIIATDVAGLQGELFQVTDGSFIFTPTAGFTGTTSYSYTVGDLVGGTDMGTVTITVEPVDGAPAVTIEQAVGQTDPTNTSPILFDVVFNEAVTGFGAEDISFAGSTVSGTVLANVTGSGSTYQVAVSGMTSNGDVRASIGAGAAKNSGGNASAASTSVDNSVTFTGVDDEAPTVRMEQGGAQEDPTSKSPIWFDVTFSEPVTGFGAEDISFTGSTVSGLLTAEVLGSGSTYLVLVSGMTSSGVVVASVLAGGATDATGHLNSASTGPDNGVTFVVENTAPIVSSVGTILEENSVAGTEVGFVSATDSDPGQTLTFSILGGNESGAFAIDGTSGRITVANSAVLDFETTAHFTLTVQALDNGVPALSASNTFDIQLIDVNEAPTLTAPATKKVLENTTAVATVTANDPDAGATLSFNLSGADAGKFRLDGTGTTRTLRFVNAPNFENPADAGRNNVYNLTVTVSDGTLSESKSIVVTVSDVREGGSKPYVINGTKRGDDIVVKERNDGRLSVTVNHKTSQVHLRSGQELRVFGLDGNDRIVLDGLKRTVLVDGGAGHDTIDASRVTSSRASLVLRGGAGGDLLVGGVGNDRLEGGNGDDVLVGNKGNDRLLGGNDNDLLIGGLGRDVLEGNHGNDALLGGPGRDSLYGGQGKDTLIGGSEDAVLDGGPGADLVLKLDRDAQAPDTQRKLLSSQPAWIRQFVG